MKKRNNIPGGHAWLHFFMACSKLEAKAIYQVKQACGNDKTGICVLCTSNQHTRLERE